jgi:5-methylcytosine-specific restriction endonuclease McrA
MRYATDENFRNAKKQQNLEYHHRTYIPKPRIPKPHKPRKATRCGSKGYWRMIIGLLAERDGWICHICHALTTWETASIDHVIPHKIREDHSPQNLRIAHRRCNHKSGYKIGIAEHRPRL